MYGRLRENEREVRAWQVDAEEEGRAVVVVVLGAFAEDPEAFLRAPVLGVAFERSIVGCRERAVE